MTALTSLQGKLAWHLAIGLVYMQTERQLFMINCLSPMSSVKINLFNYG